MTFLSVTVQLGGALLCGARSRACVPAVAAPRMAHARWWAPMTCDLNWCLQICKANYSNKFLRMRSG